MMYPLVLGTGSSRTTSPQPIWAGIAFEQIPEPLHLKCFRVASSDVGVHVQAAWRGRLQQVLVDQDYVTRRALDPRTC